MKDPEDRSLNAALDALKKSKGVDERVTGAPSDDTGDQGKRKSRNPFGSNGAFGRAAAVIDTLWNQWARPVTRFLNPIAERVLRIYKWSYSRFAFVASADGERAFSRNRAAIVTIVLVILTVMTPVLLLRNVIPAVSRTIYDAGMLATMKDDHLFLGRAELIDAERQLYQVMGCRDIRGCDGGDNTTYYRLRDNIILDVKYWTTRFEPYDPAEIAGAMVSELNDCKIRYYGRRSKALGWYPYIVNASCVPA